MATDDLRHFLRQLEQADQLARIAAPVEPHLELATIADLVSKGAGRGRGLLFENVSGSVLPVAANLFGSQERVGWAAGTIDLDGLGEQLAKDLAATGQASPDAALQALCSRQESQPRIVSDPACRANDRTDLGLAIIPAIRAWPGDGGTFLTLSQVYTRHPDGGPVNCGMYRIQCHGSHAATVRCRPGSDAARHLAAWHARDQAMPVAIALGGPPILTWAAAMPLPVDIDEVAFCGYLRGRGLAMTTSQVGDLPVPAAAEIVIEGVIEPGAFAAEGPFGNHTGSYDAEPRAPLLKVLTVHARDDAIYPWTLVGPPPMENIQLAIATVKLLMPLVKMVLPTLRDIHMPPEGIFHGAALVTVDPGESRGLHELTELLWQTPLLQNSRLLVIGAADHDPRDQSAVFWRLMNRVDWERDLQIEGKRLAVDARRLPAGEAVRCPPAVMVRVLERWREFHLGGPEGREG